MPSSMPRKITLFGVGMRLNTGAELVAGNATGVGAGCSGRPRPGLRNFGVVVVVVGGAVVGGVVVVGGSVVVVLVLDVLVTAATSDDAAVPSASLPTAWTAAAASGRAAPPLSSSGPAPKRITNAAVTPTATANRAHGGRAGRLRARRVGAD